MDQNCRRNTADGREEKSAIDLVIVSNDLLEDIDNMTIDDKMSVGREEDWI